MASVGWAEYVSEGARVRHVLRDKWDLVHWMVVQGVLFNNIFLEWWRTFNTNNRTGTAREWRYIVWRKIL